MAPKKQKIVNVEQEMKKLQEENQKLKREKEEETERAAKIKKTEEKNDGKKEKNEDERALAFNPDFEETEIDRICQDIPADSKARISLREEGIASFADLGHVHESDYKAEKIRNALGQAGVIHIRRLVEHGKEISKKVKQNTLEGYSEMLEMERTYGKNFFKNVNYDEAKTLFNVTRAGEAPRQQVDDFGKEKDAGVAAMIDATLKAHLLAKLINYECFNRIAEWVKGFRMANPKVAFRKALNELWEGNEIGNYECWQSKLIAADQASPAEKGKPQKGDKGKANVWEREWQKGGKGWQNNWQKWGGKGKDKSNTWKGTNNANTACFRFLCDECEGGCGRQHIPEDELDNETKAKLARYRENRAAKGEGKGNQK